MLTKYSVILAVLAYGANLASADTFTYNYSNSYSHYEFSFDEPSILTRDTLIPVSDLLTYNIPGLESVEVSPKNPICGSTLPGPGASCLFYSAPPQGLGLYFSSQLTSTGSYRNGYALLTITDNSGSLAPTPEPATWILLVTGLAGCLFLTPRLKASVRLLR